VKRHNVIPDWIIVFALGYVLIAAILLSGKFIYFLAGFIRGIYGIA
jgi:hypothetical protein